MKELKNRIKGLSAILLALSLALCLVVRFSGENVSAEGTLTKVDARTIDSCQNMRFSEVGAGLEKNPDYSGGYFAIEYKTDNSDNMAKYLEFSEVGSTESDVTYFSMVKVKTPLPDGYDIKITECNKVTNSDGNDEYDTSDRSLLYRLTLAWVPKATISVGTSTTLSIGTKYSFPSTGSIHKIQGDPTNYYTTDFYVSFSGTYTILQ